MEVVPEAVEFDFLAEAVKGERDRDDSNAFILERADESFKPTSPRGYEGQVNGDGTVMADGAEALFDV